MHWLERPGATELPLFRSLRAVSFAKRTALVVRLSSKKHHRIDILLFLAYGGLGRERTLALMQVPCRADGRTQDPSVAEYGVALSVRALC